MTDTPQAFTFYSQPISYKSTYDDKANKIHYTIKGHIDSGDLDLVNDIITEKCMTDISSQFKGRTIKLDFDHETLRGENDFDSKLSLTKIPLGKAITEAQDDKGNFVEFELNPTWKKFDNKGNIVMNFGELWENIQSGFYDSFSIAYIPIKTAFKEVKPGTKARLLDQVNIVNVALTGNPINPNATMTAVMAKSLEWLKGKESTTDSKSEPKSEVIKMAEEIKTEVKAEEVKQPAAVEVKSEPIVQPVVEAKPTETELKAQEILTEIKKSHSELKGEIENLKKENAELKAIFSKPMYKSLMEGADTKAEAKGKTTRQSVGPLDLI